MHFYSRIYGLYLCSDRQIPELPLLSFPSNKVDLEIFFDSPPPNLEAPIEWLPHRRFRNHSPQTGEQESGTKITESPSGFYTRLSYADGPEFIFNPNASQMWITYPDEFILETVAVLLLNSIMGFCLRVRETVCLHASAVVINNQAVLIAGSSGSGKSTLASYFALQGHPVLSDDLGALYTQDGKIIVQPGYPLLRLWPASTKALFGEAAELPKLTPQWNKRYLNLQGEDRQFWDSPLPVAGVFILRQRDEHIAVTSLRPGEALKGLMNVSYLGYLLDNYQRAVDMKLFAKMAEAVPVCYVTSQDDLATLPMLYEAILASFSTTLRLDSLV